MKTIASRQQHLETAEYLSLDQCAVYFRLSKATVRRRLPDLTGEFDLLRHGHIVRVRRVAFEVLFHQTRQPHPAPLGFTKLRAVISSDEGPQSLPVYPWSGVYFVRGADLIKIGISNCIPVRVQGLRNASPVPLDDLGWMTCDLRTAAALEASLHAQFAETRRHAEWFQPSPDLEQFIASHITTSSWPRP